MTLRELSEKLSTTEVDDSKLYFITRILKNGVKKSSKMMDKYFFNAYQVDIDNEIRQYLFSSTTKQLDYIIRKEFEMIDYDVISDDSSHLLTYSMKNKAMSFSDIVYNKLSSTPPKVKSIGSITSEEEELWAYCIGYNDVENSDWIYTFRKIQSGKIVVDEKKNKSKLKKIQTYFSTESKKLELLKGETLTLDEQIDCVYYDDIFYVIKKGCFEQIVGLLEEYKEEAKIVVSKLKESGMILGLGMIEEKIESTPSIHKKLVRIARMDNYHNLTEKDIIKMRKVCKKYNIKLNVKENKLNIESEEDLDAVLKMLADYYKTGDVSGKAYGTFSGKKIEIN